MAAAAAAAGASGSAPPARRRGRPRGSGSKSKSGSGRGRGRGRSRATRWSKPPRRPRSASPGPHSSPPPTAAAGAALGDPPAAPLPPGTEVEVRVDDDGFHGSWFEATVLDFAPARGYRHPARYTVKYVHLLADDDEGVLAEPFAPSHIRPRPPPVSPPPAFRAHDIVEAFHNEGWWSGIVVSAPDPGAGPDTGLVTVAFPVTREVIAFPPCLVRPRRDYVGGDWIPSQAAMVVRPRRAVKVYEVGEKVEVVRERASYGPSWFPATVARVVDDLSYVVEYFDLEEEGEGGPEKATEYLHWRFIRPAVEHSPRQSEFQLGPGAAVEAYCDGAWSPGVVQRVLGEDEYEISIVANKSELLVTKVVPLLKPQYKWNGSQWRIATAKRRANLRRRSFSGKSATSPVDVSSSDEEHSLGKNTLAGGSEHASVSEMDIPLSALCKSPESTHSPISLVSEKNSPQGSHGIVNSVPMNGLVCASPGHSAPLDKQEILSDMVASDSELNGPVSGRSVDAHDMLSIAELRQKMTSARRNSAVQRTQENLVKSLRVKKCVSNIKAGKTHPIQELQGKIQLKGNMNCSSKEIVLALGVNGNDRTTLSPDRQVSIGTKRGSNTKVLACKKLANRRGSKELCSPNSPLDVTSTVQHRGKKEVAEPIKEFPIALECPNSGTLEQLNRTLEDAQNITDLSNLEDLLPPVPPGFNSNGKGTRMNGTQFEEEPTGTTNSLTQPKGNDDMCTDHGATRLAKSNHFMETANLSLDSVAQQAHGNVDERSVLLRLQNAGSSQCTINSSPLTSCSAFETLFPSPLALSQLCNHQDLFVKSSPVWHLVETNQVFKESPQQPHFLALHKFPPAMREGMALGLMVSFADLVKATMEASIDNSMEWFEDKIRTMHHLEENGFSVHFMQSAMTELVRIKSESTSYHGEIGKLESKLVEKTASSARAGALLDEKDEAAAELERELGRIRQESQRIAQEKEKTDAEIMSIKAALSGYEDLHGSVVRKFRGIVDGLRRKRLS